ncbi:hypothetical protein FPHYL_7630 [Fusarium phyllophilum]|uniref:Uncharacterized protein n=1 Tax=Fusarium phyllophilum TaxID=47803 RepID=A0A8H5NAE0_9HYPO|nr:hypothetical protein FPHYL_7630 [Fusarium phyllophilum]
MTSIKRKRKRTQQTEGVGRYRPSAQVASKPGQAHTSSRVQKKVRITKLFALVHINVLGYRTGISPISSRQTAAVNWHLLHGADPDEMLVEAVLMSMRDAPLALAFRRGHGRFQNWITCRSILFALLEAGRFRELHSENIRFIVVLAKPNSISDYSDSDVFADETDEEEARPRTVVEQRPSEEADGEVLVNSGYLRAKLAGDLVRQ